MRLTNFMEIEAEAGLLGRLAGLIFHVVDVLHLIGCFNGSQCCFGRVKLCREQRMRSQAGPKNLVFHKSAQLKRLFPIALPAQIVEHRGVGADRQCDESAVLSSNLNQSPDEADHLGGVPDFA